ncbi:MAG TPA: hypothetical protein VMF31_05955 [Solirubrobacterales bacterium]|nr:hypothetical protein [Solirubrobacterales bacterium]
MFPMERKSSERRRIRFAGSLALAVVCFGLSVFGSSAEAASQPFSVEFDESLSYEGQGVFGWPGMNGVNDVVPPEPPIRVRLDGEIDSGQITADAEDFAVEPGSVPIVFFESYFDSDWVQIGPVTGSFNDATGAMTLNLNLVQTIDYEGVRCNVGPVPVTLSTESSGEVGAGIRFAEGPDGPGALVGSWDSVPAPSGSDCDLRALTCKPRHSLLKGPGAFGLARTDVGLDRVAPQIEDWTVDKFGIIGYEDEGGCLGERPGPGPGPDPDPDPEPQDPRLKIELSRLSISKSAARYSVEITNGGGLSRDTELCAYATQGLRFTTPGCRPIGSLANGASVQRRLKVTIPKGKKARAKALRKGKIKVRYVIEGIPGLTIHRKITSKR